MNDGFTPALRRWGRFFGLFALCLGLIVGCNNTSSTPDDAAGTAGATGDRLIFGTTLAPRTLDPADSYEIAGLNVIYNLGNTLYTYTPGTTELQPSLATAMPTISDDGLTYTIPLREDVSFHDGTPFTAAAMQFSLERFITNGGKPAFLLADVIERVEATDDYELTITLQQPFAAFPSVLAFAGACAVSPEAYSIGEGEFSPNEFVGTGPYQLTEFSSDTLRLEPFADYWGEAPANDGIDMQIYTDNAANLFNAFTTQAVDIAYQSLDPDQIQSLLDGAEAGDWQAIEAPGTAVNFMVLNRNQAPLDQPEVRQAIAALVNRKLINERVLQGQGEPLYSLIPTAFDTYEPSFEKTYGDANVEEAKRLLAEAGYSPENPAVIPIWFPSASTTRSLVAQTLQAFAAQELAGTVQFEPNTVDGATFFKNIQEGIYPAALSNWYPDFLDPDNFVQPLLDCDQGTPEAGCSAGSAQSQGSFYYSEAMNALIDEQRQATDPAARKELFTAIQEQLAADVPYIPLWQNQEYVFAQAGVEGVRINPSQNIPFWLATR
ncbi:MAG: peptide ABC transporter substrate-binding protein [Spirulinaceae cyanobacterium SM2_1_0]|nr:peptide ABC transporter substrate-binding protein [Spirulinaceae cyanobacterium SM2_1_0]